MLVLKFTGAVSTFNVSYWHDRTVEKISQAVSIPDKVSTKALIRGEILSNELR
jgi:hypothetical protein